MMLPRNLSAAAIYRCILIYSCLGLLALGQLPSAMAAQAFDEIQLPPAATRPAEAPATQPAEATTTQSMDVAKLISGEAPLTLEQFAALSDATTRPSPARDGDDLKITHHQMILGNRPLDYTATTGRMAIRDDAGKVQADMFFVAYQVDQPKDAPPRPITFVFNGGPGAAAVWLHLGCAGPKRVKLTEDGDGPPPPYQLVDNEQTWLDATDLVFIDPAGTGYSRVAEGVDGKQFFGLKEDIQSVGGFIRLLLTRLDRWNSPIFLAGESYGTTRAAGLSEYLLEQQGIALNGIVLISSVLNFQTIMPAAGNDMPYALYLPSYTAVAWYHKKLPADLQIDLKRAIAASERFTTDIYMPALLKGAALSDDERETVASGMARLTGLPEDLIKKANLRIDPTSFQKRLLADQQQIIGRFDSRLTGYDYDALADAPDYDPSLSRVLPVYTATFARYVSDELGYQSDLKYEVLSNRVWPWNFDKAGNGFADTGDNLNRALAKNPAMRVMVASGYFDLATPFFATDYSLGRMDIPANLRSHIQQHYYDGGHMLYHNPTSLEALHKDVAAFIQQSTKAPTTQP